MISTYMFMLTNEIDFNTEMYPHKHTHTFIYIQLHNSHPPPSSSCCSSFSFSYSSSSSSTLFSSGSNVFALQRLGPRATCIEYTAIVSTLKKLNHYRWQHKLDLCVRVSVMDHSKRNRYQRQTNIPD